MPLSGDFQYVRKADLAEIRSLASDMRRSYKLLDRTNGAGNCGISLIRTPTGGGSPEGMHTHEFEQIFYVLEGRMGVEVGGATHEVGPGAVVVFPEGEPHRNWALGGMPTLHLAINVPAPEIGKRAAIPVR